MKLDNPPAFPQALDGAAVDKMYSGMGLRDYFAGQAIIGIMSTAGAFDRVDRRTEMVARMAYQFADEMLAARGREDHE
jgi:hypothetical protein